MVWKSRNLSKDFAKRLGITRAKLHFSPRYWHRWTSTWKIAYFISNVICILCNSVFTNIKNSSVKNWNKTGCLRPNLKIFQNIWRKIGFRSSKKVSNITEEFGQSTKEYWNSLAPEKTSGWCIGCIAISRFIPA